MIIEINKLPSSNFHTYPIIDGGNLRHLSLKSLTLGDLFKHMSIFKFGKTELEILSFNLNLLIETNPAVINFPMTDSLYLLSLLYLDSVRADNESILIERHCKGCNKKLRILYQPSGYVTTKIKDPTTISQYLGVAKHIISIGSFRDVLMTISNILPDIDIETAYIMALMVDTTDIYESIQRFLDKPATDLASIHAYFNILGGSVNLRYKCKYCDCDNHFNYLLTQGITNMLKDIDLNILYNNRGVLLDELGIDILDYEYRDQAVLMDWLVKAREKKK